MAFGFRIKDTFAIRSSPIICACDALHVLACILWHTISSRSPRAAVVLVTARRFRDCDQSEQASIAGLQQNPIFRITLFAFGAMPQIIKLYGMEGIPWTTIVGSLYLSSFLVLEVLIVNLGRRWQGVISHGSGAASFQPQLKSFEYRLGLSKVDTSVWFSFYLVASAAYQIMHQAEGLWIYTIGPSILIGIIIKDLFWQKEQVSALGAAIDFLVLIGCSLSACLFIPLITAIRMTERGTYFNLEIAAIVFLSLGLLGFSVYHHHVSNESTLTRDAAQMWNWQFFFWHVISALLYYKFSYNSTGTNKPGWTEQLG